MPRPELTVTVGDTPDEAGDPGDQIDYTAQGTTAGFQLAFNSIGTGVVTVRNDDPLLAELTTGRYLRWMLDGTQVWTTRITWQRKAVVAPDEEVGHLTVVESQGQLADWQRATVQPELGYLTNPYSSARVFNFASPYYDDTDWDTPFEQFRQDEYGVPPNLLFGWPIDWPDPTIYWIWPTEKEEDEEVDPGIALFRGVATVANSGLHRACLAGDNRHRTWFDGIKILEYNEEHATQGWDKTYDLDVPASVGDHVIGAMVENIPGPVNNAGFLFGLWENAGSDGLGAKILESNDADWKCLLDPDPWPGFTVGHVLRILLEEVQALTPARLDGWSLSCTDTDDTDDNPFPVIPELVVQVGDSLHKVLEQFAESYIDFDVDITTKTLHVWVKGMRGTTSSVVFDPGVNATELDRDEGGDFANTVHYRYKDGHTQFVDTATRDGETSIERYGVREVFLSLDDVERLDAVEEYLAEWLALNAWPRESVTFGLEPTGGDLPLTDFAVADEVTVDGDPLKVVSLTCEVDIHGRATWATEVVTRGEIWAQNLERTLQAKINGTFSGRSLFSSPSTPGVFGVAERTRPQAQRLQPYSWAGEVIEDVSGTPAIDGPIRLTGIILSAHPGGGGDTTVHLNLNGSSAGSATIGAAQTEVRETFLEDLVQGDILEAECTEAGGHTGVVATPRAYYV
jgi:hypothetical protein